MNLNKKYFSSITIRTFLLAEGFGFLFSLALVWGYMTDTYDSIWPNGGLGSLGLLIALILAQLLAFLQNWLFEKHSQRTIAQSASDTAGKALQPYEEGGAVYGSWLFYTAVIFIAFLPVLLAYYPSVFAYDAEGQLYQVIARDYNTHHPLLHTLFLGLFLKLGCAIGNMNTGFFIHSLVQMLMMSCILGYSLAVLKRKGVAKGWRIALLLFYILLPTHGVLAISTTKDVIFSGLMLLFLIKLEDTWEGASSKGIVMITALMLCFRNNALYAFVIALIPMGMILFQKKKKSVWFALFAGMLISILISSGLKVSTSAYAGSPRELLSVPIQQLARVRVNHYEEMTEEEKALMEGQISSDWYYAYNPHLADPIKSRMKFDHPAGFVKAWIHFGLQYPIEYIDAFLQVTEGLWYLGDESYAQIYGVGRETGYGYLSTDYRTMPEGFQVSPDSKWPALKAGLESIVSDNQFLKVPLVRLLFHPALYVWLFLYGLLWVIYGNSKKGICLMSFFLFYLMTLFLSPAILVRYVYGYMLCVPFGIALLSVKRRKRT